MASRGRNITIREVAAAAGVSVGTVSRVLNANPSVRADARVRVMRAIDDLGYRPDAVAQSMRRGSTQMVGCIIRDINISSLAAFVHAAHSTLDQAGFSLLLSNSEGREDRERELLTRLDSQRTEGILIGPYTPITPAFDRFLRALSVPIVMVDRDQPAWADAVMVDHAGSMRRATERLLDLGHRRIALITGADMLYPARERIRGFRAAYAERGIDLAPEMIRSAGFVAETGFRQTSALLGGANPPTAIIAGGIDMLPGVIKGIRVRGLRIAEDVSVVAAGNSELAELHSPPISVMHWDQGEIGRTAVSLLLARIRDRSDRPPEHVLIESEFIDRMSIVAPRPATRAIAAPQTRD